MPRTTIDLDATVLDGLRRASERESKSMGQVASELLAPALSRIERPEPGERFKLRTARLGKPLIDLEDKESVRMALERSTG